MDINDEIKVHELFKEYQFDGVIHLAAESHVDRSISNPSEFIYTNVIGTLHLLNAAKLIWGDQNEDKVFYHISTDEVYGSLGVEGYFYEDTAYDPRSPYSASKASSDHLVRAYYHTFDLPVKISNSPAVCAHSPKDAANLFPKPVHAKYVPIIIDAYLIGESLVIKAIAVGEVHNSPRV